jgi:rare lipoprotein A
MGIRPASRSIKRMTRWAVMATCIGTALAGVCGHARAGDPSTETATTETTSVRPRHANEPPSVHHTGRVHRSGQREKGKASYYGRRFTGKKMANGARFDPDSDAAASKTLPLGTAAKVMNLANGKSATITVQDRGPYVGGRIVDVSPKTAAILGMKERGVVPVIVEPIAVPQPDGTVAAGVGATDTGVVESSAKDESVANDK